MGCCGGNPERETKNESKKDEVIKECYVKGSGPIIPEEISKILRDSIARIEFNEKKESFTGFFMKININGENFNFILTCNHSITQEKIDSKIQISIYFGNVENEEKIVIILDDKKRLIKTYEDLDVTLVQILKEDRIKEKKFLYPDLNYKNIGFSIYKDSQVYTAGYPNVDFYKVGRHLSSGLITEINGYNFYHNCDIKRGCSGFPILNLFKLVIGIHNGEDKNNENNFGTFIGAIIDKLNNEKKNIIIKKEKEEPKKANELSNIFKNAAKSEKVRANNQYSNIVMKFFDSPEFMHHASKMMNDPKVSNLVNKILIKNIPKIGENDFKDLFNEDNLEEFNDLKKSLENINNENNNNKLNEEDKKEK